MVSRGILNPSPGGIVSLDSSLGAHVKEGELRYLFSINGFHTISIHVAVFLSDRKDPSFCIIYFPHMY